MRQKIKTFCINWIKAFLYPIPFLGILYLPQFFLQYFRFSKLTDGDLRPKLKDLHPCLLDSVSSTPFDPHYFYQGAWLARKLQEDKPLKHVDVGSSVLMIGVISAQVDTTFVDYRPLKASLSGLNAISGDILDLPFQSNAVRSLSCLHVLEHIGLGRYGDKLDVQGSQKGALQLKRVLDSGGSLYVSVPIGVERICFNAHRVFDAKKFPTLFHGLELESFSYVDDAGVFHENISPADVPVLNYGCGFYHFRKS
jgi:SAM-dependent methyltransferase